MAEVSDLWNMLHCNYQLTTCVKVLLYEDLSMKIMKVYVFCLENNIMSVRLSVSVSLRFNGHFPGEPGLAGVYWSKVWWRWWWQLDYWSYKLCKAPVKSSPPTNQHPVFYRPDSLPVAQPTVSKHWRENITFHGLAYPKLTWGLPTLSLTTNSSWLPWGRVAMPLISPLMPVPNGLQTAFTG